MQKFKLDENLPAEIATLLAGAGHDAVTVPQQRLGGRPDPDIALICQQETRAIITLDLDFADIRAYPPADYAGIIVLRLHHLDKVRILSLFRRVLPLLDNEPLIGNLWIVEEASVRIRS